jgi:hypothetical protein
MTGHCVPDKSSGTSKNGSSAASKAKSSTSETNSGGGASQKPLNLAAPDIRTVVSPEELKEPLPSDEITETEESDTVSVKGEANAPDVPGGFGALWWALNHPSQAWRILAPAQ